MSGGPSSGGASSSSDHHHEEDLTTLLRTQTRKQHASSDRIVHLFAPFALSSPRVYRLLLVSFYHIFKALEEELETRRLLYPKIAPIYFRELLRTKAFEKDLAYYYNNNEQALLSIPSPSTATIAYIKEMRAAIEDEPVVLISYCHAMYMGLLSGGRIIKRWCVTAFSLTPPTGVEIFEFAPGITDVKAFKTLYFDAINSVALSSAQRTRIIDQKKRVFECNNEVMKEVCLSGTSRKRTISVICKILGVLLVGYLVWMLLFSTAVDGVNGDGSGSSGEKPE